MQIEDACRWCQGSLSSGSSELSTRCVSPNESLRYANILKECFGIRVKRALRRAVCTACANRLRDAWKFRCDILISEKGMVHYGRKKRAAETNATRTDDTVVSVAKQRSRDAGINVAAILKYSDVIPFVWRGNIYSCFYCKTSFYDIVELKSHTKFNHRGDQPNLRKLPIKIDVTNVNCRLCPDKVPDVATLLKHLRSKHNKRVTDCDKGFLTYKLDGAFQCHLCIESFVSFHLLNQHMNTHNENYVCEQCGKGFMTNRRLTIHKNIHLTGEHPCFICSKIFNTERKLQLHIEGVHEGRSRSKCNQCGEFFKEHPQLLKHLVQEHGHEPIKYTCELCGRVLNTKKQHTHHIQRDHLGLRIECDECGKKFFRKMSLREHQATHNGELTHFCDICEKGFATRKRLLQHKKLHTSKACKVDDS